jgi:hypothetical protein
MTDFGPEQRAPPPGASDSRKILLALTAALAAWGLYLSLGAFFGGFGKENLPQSVLRSGVVLACVGGFLGIWWLLMLTRKSRNSRTDGRQ